MVEISAVLKDERLFDDVYGLVDQAVLVLDRKGTIERMNDAASGLFGPLYATSLNGTLMGSDVRDVLYSADAARAFKGELPFTTDGSQTLVVAKMLDGSLVPTRVRCRWFEDVGRYVLVAQADTVAGEDGTERLLGEFKALSRRMRSTLDIVSSASQGGATFEDLSQRVARELEHALLASASALYLADVQGFTPYGISDGFRALGLDPVFVPQGEGITTLAARLRRTVRLERLTAPAANGTVTVLDVDANARYRLVSCLAGPCVTLVATPILSGDDVVAVAVAGWTHAHVVAPGDVHLLQTVAGFLSIELAASLAYLEQCSETHLSEVASHLRALVRERGPFDRTGELAVANLLAAQLDCLVAVAREGILDDGVVLLLCDGATQEPLAFDFPYGLDELLAEACAPKEPTPSSRCGLWFEEVLGCRGPVVALLEGETLAPGEGRCCLVAMRRAGQKPLDRREGCFMGRVPHEIALTLVEERERNRTSLIASALQKGLHNELTPTPGVTARSLYISATASAVVGGDFFDLYGLADGRVVVITGDVSGKGVGAAATASFIKTVLAAYAWSGFDPASMVSSLNDLLLNFSQVETFATVAVVVIDPATSRIAYCSAGHPPTMLVHRPCAPDASMELFTAQSPIVGAFENPSYENGYLDLEPGDVIFLYTDGITEARSPNGTFFGEEALGRALLRSCPQGVEAVPGLVHEAVAAFTDGRFNDDMALVAVRYDGVGVLDRRASPGEGADVGAPGAADGYIDN